MRLVKSRLFASKKLQYTRHNASSGSAFFENLPPVSTTVAGDTSCDDLPLADAVSASSAPHEALPPWPLFVQTYPIAPLLLQFV